jgi:hypothetical protein
LYPFFDLHNVPIKAVKTDLPFIVSFFVEYTYYRKIGGAALGHRWELQYKDVCGLAQAKGLPSLIYHEPVLPSSRTTLRSSSPLGTVLDTFASHGSSIQ